MAGERYMQKAVVSLQAFLVTNLGGKLDTVESEQSLTSGSMVDPSVIGAFVPDDNRSALLEVFPLNGEAVEERQRLYACNVGTALSWSSDADLEAGTLQIMRYHTALLKTVQADYSLGAAVNACIPGRFDYAAERGSSALTRFTVMQDFQIHIQDGA